MTRRHRPEDRYLEAIEDSLLDREHALLLAAMRRLIHQQGEDLMATLEDLQAAVAETGTSAQAAADRVIAAIAAARAEASTQIADLQTQVQTLIDGNLSDITPEDLQALADSVTAIDATVDAIAPDLEPAP